MYHCREKEKRDKSMLHTPMNAGVFEIGMVCICVAISTCYTGSVPSENSPLTKIEPKIKETQQ